MPTRVIVNTDTIMYIYDATGNKWAGKKLTNIQKTVRYYMNIFEYNHTTLEYIHNAYGRVRLAQNEYHYDYFLSDHLGNIRVVFTQGPDGEAELLQSSNYYPFGMRFGAGPEYESEQNKYLYNGKELQEYAGLEMYDYGWRQYDAALGRWHVQDQLAEKYNSFSPYAYVMNSPINYIDPDGRYVLEGSAARKLFATLQAASFTIGFDYIMDYAEKYGSAGGGFELLYEFEGITGAWVFKAGGQTYYPQGYYYKDKNGNIHNTTIKHNIKYEAQSSGVDPINVENSTNLAYDILTTVRRLNDAGTPLKLQTIVDPQSYTTHGKIRPIFNDYGKIGGYDYKVTIMSQSNLDNRENYFDASRMGWGHLNIWWDGTKTTSWNEGYYQGFYMINTYKNMIISIGVQSDEALYYLKYIYQSTPSR